MPPWFVETLRGGPNANKIKKVIGPGVLEFNEVSPLEQLYAGDHNILVASWINDLGYQQKELEDKVLFYNSESILNNGNVLDHFKKDNARKFADKKVEFSCKKGARDGVN